MPNISTQPTDSQASVQSSPRHTQAPIRSQSPSTPETNCTRNINISLLSSPHSTSPPRPIGSLFHSSTTSIDNYQNSANCVERIVHDFSLNSSLELPTAFQNVSNQDNTNYFRSFNAAINLDDTLESDAVIKINHLLSFSLAKKTKGIETLQNTDLEVQFTVPLRCRGLYFRPTPLLVQKKTYKTLPASFVCSRLKIDLDPTESSAHGTATFYNTCSKFSY